MNDLDVILDKIDELIIKALEGSEKPPSTYMLAKETRTSWSTVNTHCYKLKSLGIIESITTKTDIGQKKTFWKLKAKTPSLSTYMK